MKKLFTIGAGLLLQATVFAQTTAHPPKCGMQAMHEAMIAKSPAAAEMLKQQRESLQAAADYYTQYKTQAANEKTTSVSAIPVIFHIVVDSAQFNNLGGTAGIIKRCDSQIAVLNADYNRQNGDSTLIPNGWKPLFGNTGIHFGLARVDPSGNCTPGYEVRIIVGTLLTDGFGNDSDPKHYTTNGLNAWDNTKYYNVWCVNFVGSYAGLLGITAPKSGAGSCGWCTPVNETGVCILYNTLGKTAPGTGGWPTPYNLGRTLTHETGHFFEIWHTWGDDGGACPWSSGGSDDGLNDTPPESDNVFGNPTYTISGGTYNDACKLSGVTNTQPIGIACLSYMDYTDDNAMHLFTPNQAAAMASMVLVPATGGTGATGSGMIGENYSLTQHASLLVCPTGVKPTSLEVMSSLSVYPNPTTGEVNVSINSANATLNQITVVNLLGQQVMVVSGQNKDYYTLNLAGMSKGIYFVTCQFATGTVTRKILLQ